jgi:hypothetical protein
VIFPLETLLDLVTRADSKKSTTTNHCHLFQLLQKFHAVLL